VDLSYYLDFLYSLGFTLLAVSTPTSSWLLYPAGICIDLAGFGLNTGNFQIADFSKPFRNLILTFLNGLFDSSVFVLVLVKKGYHTAGTDLSFILILLTVLTTFLWLRTYSLLPRKNIPFLLPSKFNFGWKEINCFNNETLTATEMDSHLPNPAVACDNCKDCVTGPISADETYLFKKSLKNFLFLDKHLTLWCNNSTAFLSN